MFRSAILPRGFRFLVLGLWLLLVAPASPAVTEGTASGPTTTAPAASTNLTTFEANGFRVALDTTGFKHDLGYEKFHENYFRLAQFHNRTLAVAFLDFIHCQLQGLQFFRILVCFFFFCHFT